MPLSSQSKRDLLHLAFAYGHARRALNEGFGLFDACQSPGPSQSAAATKLAGRQAADLERSSDEDGARLRYCDPANQFARSVETPPP